MEAESKKRKRGKELRAWVFTDNCPKHWLKLPEGVRYMIWQLERGEHLHHQGYVECLRGRTLVWMKENVSDTAHWEGRRGTQAQAIHYCKKPVEGCDCKPCCEEREKRTKCGEPYELGTKSPGQGARMDISEYVKAIKKGKRKRDLIMEMPYMLCKYPRFYYTVREQTMPRRVWDMQVILAIGKTGTGKSYWGFHKWAYREDEGISYWKMPANNGTVWFDGYDDHMVAHIDEFAGRKSCMRLDVCLEMLDVYPARMPVKNAHTWWLPDILYLTTNIHPKDWYKWKGREDQRAALKRRFTKVLDFNNKVNGQPTEVDMRTWEWDDVEDEDDWWDPNGTYSYRTRVMYDTGNL